MVGPLAHSHSEMSDQPAQNQPREQQQQQAAPHRDDGLRKLLTWTFIALVVAIAMAVLGVGLVIKVFDPGVSG
jgi:hypothetical protein